MAGGRAHTSHLTPHDTGSRATPSDSYHGMHNRSALSSNHASPAPPTLTTPSSMQYRTSNAGSSYNTLESMNNVSVAHPNMGISGSGHTQSSSRPIMSDNYRQPNTSRPSNLAPHNHSHFNSASERSLSNYQQHFGNHPGYGPAGPSSLPGSINTPKHQDDPQRGAYGRPSIQDDIELRGASDIVEKDSPPTSFISSPGPSSLNMQHHQYTPGQMMPSQPPPPSSSAALALPPGVGRRHLSHQLPPRTPLAGVVGGSQMGSTGRGLSNSFDSRIGANSATSADRNIPRNYPHQETATPSSTHASSPVRLKPSAGVLGTAGMGSNRLEVGIDQDIMGAADDVIAQLGEGRGEHELMTPTSCARLVGEVSRSDRYRSIGSMLLLAHTRKDNNYPLIRIINSNYNNNYVLFHHQPEVLGERAFLSWH